MELPKIDIDRLRPLAEDLVRRTEAYLAAREPAGPADAQAAAVREAVDGIARVYREVAGALAAAFLDRDSLDDPEGPPRPVPGMVIDVDGRLSLVHWIHPGDGYFRVLEADGRTGYHGPQTKWAPGDPEAVERFFREARFLAPLLGVDPAA